jgi:hypothetical protein
MKMASKIVIEVQPHDVEKARPEEVPRDLLGSVQIQSSSEVRPVGRRKVMQLQKSIAEGSTKPPKYFLPVSD